MRSLRGQLLVATPALQDPNFFRTVILILEHGDDGAIGLVLNRATDHPIVTSLPQLGSFVSEPDVVFIGGPVAPETAIALGRLRSGIDGSEDWAHLTGDIGLLDLESTPPSRDLTDVRVFAGYSGWDGGQLESELAHDAWLVVAASTTDITTSNPDNLWSAVLGRQPGPLAMLANYPDEPAWN